MFTALNFTRSNASAMTGEESGAGGNQNMNANNNNDVKPEHNHNHNFQLSHLGIVNPLTLISKVGTLVVKPIVRMGEIFTIQESTDEHQYDEEEDAERRAQVEEQLLRMSLEGTLYHRKGRSHKWKRRLVILKFENGGSFECYKVTSTRTPTNAESNANENENENPTATSQKDNQIAQLDAVFSQLHRQSSVGSTIQQMESKTLKLVLTRDTPWMVRDIENDASTFVIEIPTDNPQVLQELIDNDDDFDQHRDRIHAGIESSDMSSDEGLLGDVDGDVDIDMDMNDPLEYSAPLASSPTPLHHNLPSVLTKIDQDKLEKDFHYAKKRNLPMRLYFKCPRKGNEKALWLRGFAKVDRLSQDTWNKRRFLGKIAHIGMATSRLRKDSHAEFTRDARHLEMGGDILMSPQYRVKAKTSAPLKPATISPDRREFKVYPAWCYPHVWMTQSELREECNLPSTDFHDLRIDATRGQEIGTLRVEVLQCMGLPHTEKSGVGDTVVYLVCGSYAFATDVIHNNANPYWLRKSRRACIFPIFHGYARMFVGVFDDVRGPKDQLVGRVVIDLSKLRPNSKYDVTLPLRPSAQVYSRRSRGVIRLRFQLDWHNQHKALTSYLPTTLKIPKKTSPDTNTTVMCTDAASFRNIALTVHGTHLPGKFNFNHFRAALKEITFSRKMTMLALQTTLRETRTWVNPPISLFVFCAWMHCIYQNSFGLVPAYFTTFIMLHLFRNYARYAMDGPSSRGFAPPSWEEMFLTAIFGSPAIQPLTMTPRDNENILSPLDDITDRYYRVDHKISTHKFLGKPLFRAAGFLESEEDLKYMDPDERHLEFPFAIGRVYPKISIHEAMAPKSSALAAKKSRQDSINRSHHPGNNSMHRSSHCGGDVPRHIRNKVARRRTNSEADDGLSVSVHGNRSPAYSVQEEEMLTASVCGDDNDPFSIHESSLGGDDLLEEDFDPDLPMNPDQDIDFHVSSGDKKMTDDLNEIKHNMHRLTWHLFNDQTHIIKHPEAAYFGYGKKVTKRKHVNRDLQKLLGVGYYSSSNILMARVAVYIAPIVDSSASFLCGFRAMFNIFTWRDSYFSFWVSLGGILLAAILFVFPWRSFMLGVGLVVVGPQNLIIRWIRERRAREPKTEKTEEKSLSRELPTDQPLVKSHPPPNVKHRDVNVAEIDPREVHHVVVPYSPWSNVGTRFNDWPPPNNEYCCVKPKPMGHSRLLHQITSPESSEHGFVPSGIPHYITTGPTRPRSFTSDGLGPGRKPSPTERRRSFTPGSTTMDYIQKQESPPIQLVEARNAVLMELKYRGRSTTDGSQTSGISKKIKYRSE